MSRAISLFLKNRAEKPVPYAKNTFCKNTVHLKSDMLHSCIFGQMQCYGEKDIIIFGRRSYINSLKVFTNVERYDTIKVRNKPNMTFGSIFLYGNTLSSCVHKDLNLVKSTSSVFVDMDILLFVKGLFRSNRGLCFFGCVASVAHLFIC